MKKLCKSICYATILSISLSSAMAIANTAAEPTKESVGEYVDGSLVTATVKSKILADENLKGTDISVVTANDTVRLTGVVYSAAQKREAEKLAKLVDGVKTVDNKLVVKK
jgi:hyperosmotically inducible protein